MSSLMMDWGLVVSCFVMDWSLLIKSGLVVHRDFMSVDSLVMSWLLVMIDCLLMDDGSLMHNSSLNGRVHKLVSPNLRLMVSLIDWNFMMLSELNVSIVESCWSSLQVVMNRLVLMADS